MGYEQEDTRLNIALEGMKLIRSKAQRGEIYPEDYPNILEWTREAIHFLQKYAMPQLMEIEDRVSRRELRVGAVQCAYRPKSMDSGHEGRRESGSSARQ